jgi:hypothetical protein
VQSVSFVSGFDTNDSRVSQCCNPVSLSPTSGMTRIGHVCRHGSRSHILGASGFGVVQVCRLVSRKVCGRSPAFRCDKVTPFSPPQLARVSQAISLPVSARSLCDHGGARYCVRILCVGSLPEKTPLLPTAAESYQQIQDQPYTNRELGNYGSRPPSQAGDKESLRNPDFRYVPRGPPSSRPSSVFSPAQTGADSRDSGYPTAYDATQKYLSMTSGRPLVSQMNPPQDAPYQAQAREAAEADPAMTARSSLGASMMSRRSREERLASLKSVVKRQDDISMA